MSAAAIGQPGRALEGQIEACLRRTGDRLTRQGASCWRLTRGPAGRSPTVVRVVDDWLVVERALPGCRLARRADVRRWEQRLLGGPAGAASVARAVLTPGSTRVRLRAERALPSARQRDEEALWRWLERAVGAVAADPSGASDDRDATTAPAAPEPDVAEICALAGWPAAGHSVPGEASVPLPDRGGAPAKAMVGVHGSRARFRVETAIEGDEVSTPASRAAVAVALLRVAGGVRLVRASARGIDAPGGAAVLEVNLELPLEPEQTGHALSALTVAHRQIAAEIDALARDDALARAYLTVQGLR